MAILIGILGGAFCSWFISHSYYRRTLSRARDQIEKEVLTSKITNLHGILAKMADSFLETSNLAGEGLQQFIEANAEQILLVLGHHKGFVHEMLRDHRDEIDFTTIDKLDACFVSLWYKYW